MKTKGKLVLTGLLLAALIMACIPTSVYAAIYQAGVELFAGYSNMTEEEIYNSKKYVPADDLIAEIIELENALPSMNDKIAIVPHLMALIEKSDEFTAGELIALIEDPNTDVGLDSAFVKMYVNKGADASNLISLLDDNDIAQETKEYIVALGDFSTTELSTIFEDNNSSIAVVAMKRIAVVDEELAFELAMPIFTTANKTMTSEQYVAACLGAAQFFEKYTPKSAEEEAMFLKMKEQMSTQLQSLYSTYPNDLVKDQAIYAMARMGDYDLFEYIIESESIDFDLKVTTIERNVELMVEKVSAATSLEDISTIIIAMQLHPIADGGNALSNAVSNGRLTATAEITALINYIETNGIEGVNKYEKE